MKTHLSKENLLLLIFLISIVNHPKEKLDHTIKSEESNIDVNVNIDKVDNME